jgi:hypothetical protein
MPRYAMYVDNPLVAHNPWRRQADGRAAAPARAPGGLPSWTDARSIIPAVNWDGHPQAAACWDAAWRVAFGNLRRPSAESGFASPFIDTAFNDRLFMWDSSFIMMFARYGRRAFPFQGTLDNFYAHQHPDGFICREINESDGDDAFDRFDPSATGPNILPWAEWESFLHTGDTDRLSAVLPPLVAYHRWFRTWRTWPDGSYWATGWASGMDNQPRMPPGNVAEHNHGHMSWLDTCAQQALSARLLITMNDVLGSPWPVDDMKEELAALDRFINEKLWSDAESFYYDRWPDGTLAGAKSVGAFWALLAGVVPAGRLDPFIGHLSNRSEFARPHRVPSLSADHPLYRPGGDYWRGSVWAPTNYMVLRALRLCGRHDLAHEIALNHLTNVYRVFEETGTLWENYAPETAARGEQSARDFVGWTGLPPIAILLEFVFGLQPDPGAARLTWDVRLAEGHGVQRYPFGEKGEVYLSSHPRPSTAQPPIIEAESSVPLALDLRWPGGSETVRLTPGRRVTHIAQGGSH